jgi:bacteriocin biosynthesis cyclodehydratase domain-containing protein
LLICLINGIEGVVGPFVVPGRTPCLMCQHLRVVRNLDFYQEYVAWEKWAMTDGKERRTQTGALAPFTDMIAGMAAIEVFKFASGFHEPETYGKFITVDALTLEVIPHQVLRLPRCPDCGKARSKPITSPWQGV